MGEKRDAGREPRSDAVRVVYGIGGYNSEGMKSDNPHAGIHLVETARTLDLNGGNHACNQGGVMILETKCYAIDHVVTGGGNCTAQGKCWYEEVCPTLKGAGVHAVCYGLISKGNGEVILSKETHMSLSTGGGQAGQGYPAVLVLNDQGGRR